MPSRGYSRTTRPVRVAPSIHTKRGFPFRTVTTSRHPSSFRMETFDQTYHFSIKEILHHQSIIRTASTAKCRHQLLDRSNEVSRLGCTALSFRRRRRKCTSQRVPDRMLRRAARQHHYTTADVLRPDVATRLAIPDLCPLMDQDGSNDGGGAKECEAYGALAGKGRHRWQLCHHRELRDRCQLAADHQ